MRNLTLLTDFYELTMMQGYFKSGKSQDRVIFDMYYRKNPCGNGFSICCGLEQVVEYIRNLNFNEEDIDYLRSLKIFDEDFIDYLRGFHFTGDIYAIPEGTAVFPREPLVKVIAPVIEAQLIESALLNIINHQSLIATKASRVVHAAAGDSVMDLMREFTGQGRRLLQDAWALPMFLPERNSAFRLWERMRIPGLCLSRRNWRLLSPMEDFIRKVVFCWSILMTP